MINEPIKGFVYVTLLSRQIYKLTALCMEEAGCSSTNLRVRLKKLS